MALGTVYQRLLWSYHEALRVFSSIPRCSIPLNLRVRGKGTLAEVWWVWVCVWEGWGGGVWVYVSGGRKEGVERVREVYMEAERI